MKQRVLVFMLFALIQLNAQYEDLDGGPIHILPNGIQNGNPMEHVPTKRMIPYEYVREADVTWSKRVWRIIDLREKMNLPIYLPFDEFDSEGRWITNSDRWSLWTIIRCQVLRGKLTLFSPYNPYQFTLTDGDQFKYPIVPEPGKNYYRD